MAEISSRYIVAGGPYTWAALGGTETWWKKFFPFVNAWLIMFSFFGSMASVNTSAAQALYAMDIMHSYGAKRGDAFVPRELDLWDPVTEFSHQGENNTWKNVFGITVAITLSQFALNLLPLRLMNKASWVSFLVMIFGSLILSACPAMSLHARCADGTRACSHRLACDCAHAPDVEVGVDQVV